MLFLIQSVDSSSTLYHQTRKISKDQSLHIAQSIKNLPFNGDHDSYNNKKNVYRDTSSKLLDWNTAVTIPCGVLILIGGGLTLANGFTSTGLGGRIVEQVSFLDNANYIIIILVFVTLAILPTEMISNTATTALLLPISASLVTSMWINPILFMEPVAIATS